MTLLSNAFVAAPSTTSNEPEVIAGANTDSQSATAVNESPSPSTSSSPSTIKYPNEDGPTPSQILAMTIKKKRHILRSRDRNLRLEILLTSTIRRLCQEIGDHLRARRMASVKRKATNIDQESTSSSTVRQSDSNKRTRLEGQEEVGLVEACRPESPSSMCSVGPLARDDEEQKSETESIPSSKCDRGNRLTKRPCEFEDKSPRKRAVEEPFDEKDPFGLDDFFRSLSRTCRVGGESKQR